MATLNWLRSKLSPKFRVMWLLRRGIAHAKAGRASAAMQDYSEVVDQEYASLNTRAMALFNRALLQSASGDEEAASKDLRALLEMNGVSQEVATEARRKLTRISRSSDRTTARDEANSDQSAPR